MLDQVEPGLYTLIVDNAPVQYEQVSYVLNQEPLLSDVTASCGNASVDGVTVTCNGAQAGAQVNITWNASDDDSPEATVRVSYSQVLSDGLSLDSTNQSVIVEQLPLGAGNATWDLGDVSSGSYKVVVTVEDGEHAPVETAADVLIQVTDQRAPTIPTGLRTEPLPGELLVMWTPNTEKDIAGYEIGFGVVDASQADDPSRFIYARDMGAKEVELPSGDVLDAKLWGLSDNEAVFVGIRAYDLSGNYSEWSPLLQATPWPLSPAAWTPAPNGQGGVIAPVQVAFETSLLTETLTSAIVVQQADGAQVAGVIAPLLDVDNVEAVGVSFIPAEPLTDGTVYTVTVRGGEAGVTALDGRRMPSDYTWSFTASAQAGPSNQLFLPTLNRQPE
jgi:hypothetical protein